MDTGTGDEVRAGSSRYKITNRLQVPKRWSIGIN
jgi:hypothetical protein